MSKLTKVKPQSVTEAIKHAKQNQSDTLILNGTSNHKLSEIPDDVFELTHLKNLYLAKNSLTTIPRSISQLINLEKLDISQNTLSTLPDSMGSLEKLKELYLYKNRFTEFPNSIVRLESLQLLSLWKNSISVLPREFVNLVNLKNLDLTDNPITIPPPEIVARGPSNIRGYFSKLLEGDDHLFEAKLLILGEGGAGKTTLAQKIKNPAYRLQDEISTQGIDVLKWSFPIENNKKFRVNIWDFGGQEIYHTTHQFFLTKRSLYMLVADTRKEDTDFYYWLNVVELLSESSPLIIIKNEKQDRHREVNERQLRGQFDNLKDVFETNLATNRGLNRIMSEIKHYIQNLPHVGAPLPKTWVRIREELEQDPRNHITLEQYFAICRKHGFSEMEDSLQLSGYLHDIGVHLHFQDDPLLRKTVILKPKWGTDAVYKVLDNQKVVRNLGRFNREDINNIWSASEYANMHDELLQLMMKFRLCYQIPNKEKHYIAPQLLTENQPSYKWNDEENLYLRFSYDFMPKGILTQFIVATHPYILEQKYVWKSGVLLDKDKTLADVIEHYDKREIRIRASGPHKKELMIIVTHELDKIHATYKKLKYDRLIPCNCEECFNTTTPHFYHYERLQKFIEDKQLEIQCQLSYGMVNVRGLIDDVIGWQGGGKSERLVPAQPQPLQNQISIGDNFSGTFILGSTVKKSLNKIKSAPISGELKDNLVQLVQAVENMKTVLSKDQSNEVSDDLERLITEAIKESPDKKWYSVSIDGLTSAAENLDKLGEPVVNLSKKIFSLLTMGVNK